jgi:hypothetical protein
MKIYSYYIYRTKVGDNSLMDIHSIINIIHNNYIDFSVKKKTSLYRFYQPKIIPKNVVKASNPKLKFDILSNKIKI